MTPYKDRWMAHASRPVAKFGQYTVHPGRLSTDDSRKAFVTNSKGQPVASCLSVDDALRWAKENRDD